MSYPFEIGAAETKFIYFDSAGVEVWQIGSNQFKKFTDVVVEIYRDLGWITSDDEAEKIYLEDLEYCPHSILIAVRPPGRTEILATVRMMLKNDKISFPFEYFFGVDLKEICSSLPYSPEEIWHSSRINVDKRAVAALGYSRVFSIELLKVLIRAIYKVCAKNTSNILLGENFIKNQRLYGIMGFPMTICATKEYFEGVMGCAAYFEIKNLKDITWLKE